jgi:hypothetical protein
MWSQAGQVTGTLAHMLPLNTAKGLQEPLLVVARTVLPVMSKAASADWTWKVCPASRVTMNGTPAGRPPEVFTLGVISSSVSSAVATTSSSLL